ncbi:MAG: DUF1232 domain-containing protein [Bacteroidales bacterium]|nr:DUF1232 domain-containing protein [Bacteroidales bacterium]
MENKVPDQQMIIASQKHYSEEGLWDKVKSVAKKAGIKVIYLALLLYYTATAESTPTAKKGIIYGALGYFILPIDLIPDVIPVAGFSDDLAALLACAAAVASCITPEIKQQAKDKLTEWFGEFDESQLDKLA